MQSKRAVFRTEKTLKEGVDQMETLRGMNDVSVKDNLYFLTQS